MRVVVFSPHPDDLSISMGALTALLAAVGAEITAVLVTDGSESLIPENVLREHGWHESMGAEEQRALRGRIRITEAREEALRLGVTGLRVMERQEWFTRHATLPQRMRADLSLITVEDFRPGPITGDAAEEFRALMSGANLCAAPDANDHLRMHRVVTRLVQETRDTLPLLTYGCLSTVAPGSPQTLFGFEEGLMERKCHAIRAHRSMFERRRQFGGYSNPGTEGYDKLVMRKNAELAAAYRVGMPYAETYGWHR